MSKDDDVCRCRYAHPYDWEGRCVYCGRFGSWDDLENCKGLKKKPTTGVAL